MPSLSNPRTIDMAPEPLSWVEREYRSPDGSWRVLFHDPDEFHMGATGWTLSLLERGRSVTPQHPFLVKHAGHAAVDCSPTMAPWSHDSRTLLVVTWARTPVLLYDIVARTGIVTDLPERPITAQWDPGGPHAFVLYGDNVTIVDPRGTQVGVVRWHAAMSDRPSAFWLPSGNLLFVIRRAEGRTHARFFTSAGTLVDDLSIDPLDLVPFDAERFASVGRDRFTLVVNQSTAAAGDLLDTWDDVRFDPQTRLLQLAVYRPQGDPYQDRGITVCRVAKVWVAVEISA